MENLEIGKNYVIHSYKHNGKIYKSWEEAVLLSYDEKTGIYVFGNDRTKVTEEDGRNWYTKEQAVLFFFRNHWYNIIVQYKDRGIFYYCNLASPILIEEGAIKYVDYDLDIKVFPTGSFRLLDRNEYYYHKKKMNYPKELDKIIKQELSHLIDQIRKKQQFFDHNYVDFYHDQYEKLRKKKS